jgi:hypothetical protein
LIDCCDNSRSYGRCWIEGSVENIGPDKTIDIYRGASCIINNNCTG